MIWTLECGRDTVKTILLIATMGLLLIALTGCGGPSEEDAAARADQVVPRAQELMLTAAFSPVEECRTLAGEFAEEYEVDAMPYDDAGPKEAMSKLEKLDKGLDEFEAKLDELGCLS